MISSMRTLWLALEEDVWYYSRGQANTTKAPELELELFGPNQVPEQTQEDEKSSKMHL